MKNHRVLSIEQAKNQFFDLVIIGGGATGAGMALDASLRGYKVLLVEKGDFASQTSSKSTKLIHGGVRYLEQAVKKFDFSQLKMVYKALQERKSMIKNAPHLSKPLALITPCYNIIEKWYYGIGMKLYDLLAGSSNLMPSSFLTNRKINQICPGLNTQGMVGGILYFDGQMNDARYNLSLVFSAKEEGAVCLNYTSLIKYLKGSKDFTLYLKDEISSQEYPVKSRAVVNAGGPFSDQIRWMANPFLKQRLKVSRGSHIVLDQEFFPGENALLIPKTQDGRVIFVIPFRGYVLVGTTDDPDELSFNPKILESEKTYLLDYFNKFAKKSALLSDIKGSFVGQRPLISVDHREANETKSLVRDHLVEFDSQSGLVSVLGGKWTTYRVMAEDALDLVEQEIFHTTPTACTTKNYLLSGGKSWDPLVWNEVDLSPNEILLIEAHWKEIYGSDSGKVKLFCDQTANGWDPIITGAPYRQGEIAYCCANELVVLPEDIVERRWGITLRDQGLSDALLFKIKEKMNSFKEN